MIGVDIIRIDRIEKLKKHKTFYAKFFTQNEYEYIEKKNFSNNTIAGLIAAKEAISKVFKTGIGAKLGLLDIEILHDKNVPYVNMNHDRIRKLATQKGVKNLDISISHDGDYAMATSVATEGFHIDIDEEMISLLPKRKANFNKYDYGKVLIIGGKKGMSGSIRLAATSAMKSGAGMVYIYTPKNVAESLSQTLIEPIIYSVDEDSDGQIADLNTTEFIDLIQKMDAIAIGPGLGKPVIAGAMLKIILENFIGPVVIDADGLNVISGEMSLLKLKKNVYITPHHMEFSRVSGKSLDEINSDREMVVTEFLKKYDINVLLKGNNSLVINRRRKYINQTGNSGMAKAGSGDSLTGILVALLARKDNFDMLKLATYIHGLCGDLAKIKLGEDSMTASDLVEQIPAVMKEMRNNE